MMSKKKKKGYATSLEFLPYKKANVLWYGKFLCGLDLAEAKHLMGILGNYIKKHK